jgi:type IV pilus assembly protein PilX
MRVCVNEIANQCGWALLTALLFSFVITGLLLSTLENNLLDAKVAHYFYDKMIAFESAEAGLLAAESEIQNKTFMAPLSKATVTKKIEIIHEDACHKKTYQITVSAQYQHAKIKLQSIYDFLPNPQTTACLSEKINQRLFWRELI